MDKLPTVTIQKDGKCAIVNESDLAQWQANGWDVPEAEKPEGPAPEAPAEKPKPRKK